jgi:DNA-binding GntR family transcriptional regulator
MIARRQRFDPRRPAVVDPTEDEALHVLIPIRLTLEQAGFRAALPRLNDVHLAAVGRQLWRMESALRHGDLAALVDSALSLHEIVLEQAAQPTTIELWRRIRPAVRDHLLRHWQQHDHAIVLDRHRALVSALRTRDHDAVLPLLELDISAPATAGPA